MKRTLLAVALTLLAALAIAIVPTLLDFLRHDMAGGWDAEAPRFNPSGIVAGFAVLVLLDVARRRDPFFSKVLSLALVSLTLLLITGLAAAQSYSVHWFRASWVDKGWPVGSAALVRSGDGCPGLRRLSDDLSAAVDAPSKEVLDDAFSAVDRALREGGSVDAALEERGLASDAAWGAFERSRPVFESALQSCDWRWSDKEDRLPLVAAARWSRDVVLRTLSHSLQSEGASPCECLALRELAERIRARGSPVIDAFIAETLETRIALCVAARAAVDGAPLGDDERSVAERGAVIDPESLRGTLDAEREYGYEACENPEPESPNLAPMVGREPDAWIWTTPLVLRARFLGPCLRNLAAATEYRERFGREVGWAPARLMIGGNRDLPAPLRRVYPGLYERALRRVAIWRVVLAADALRRYALEHGSLPESAALVAGWPRDPFDGRAIRFRRDGERSARVYSVGADFEDGGGATLAFAKAWPELPSDLGLRLEIAGALPP